MVNDPRTSCLVYLAYLSAGGQIAVALGALVALAVAARLFIARRRVIRGTLRVVADLIEGRTDRRVDPTARGLHGELARAVNTLAARLEEAQARAEQDRENLAALLEHTDALVAATDEEDNVQLVSPALARLLDRPEKTLLGRPIMDLFTSRELLDLYHSAYSSSEAVSGDLRLKTARREIQARAIATTMYTGARYRGTLLLMRDWTEIAQALQMKADFVANASHELRTPLASIRAAVETIQDSLSDAPGGAAEAGGAAGVGGVKRCVDIIAQQVLRLQLMVQDLLDLSRTEDARAVVRMDRVDLAHVCDMVVGMYAGVAAEKGIALTMEIDPEARALRGDERFLILTLKNLVDNSLKFTPAGGRVAIVSAPGFLPAREAAGGTSGAGAASGDPAPAAVPRMPAVVLAVTDTGCGIPPEDRQRVFERFYTVNRSRGGADRGTGLGLAIVKHAVAAMGGSVQLESQVNAGTTIRCVFPAQGAAAGETVAVGDGAVAAEAVPTGSGALR